jgi:hypothetical protein
MRAQLDGGVKGDQPVAGVAAALTVYEQAKHRFDGLSIPTLERWLQLRQSGGLDSAISTAAAHPLPDCSRTAQEPSSPSAGGPGATAGVNIAVPRHVADFELLERHDYDDKSSGVQLRYRDSDSVLADVFVYPGPDLAGDCAQECAAKTLDAEIADFRDVIPELIKRGYAQAMTVVSEEPLIPSAGAPWRLGRHMRLAVKHDDRPMRSEFYLYYLPGYRVKVRATYDDAPARSQSVEKFAAAIVPALAGTDSLASTRSSARPAANERNAISISATLRNRPSQVFLAAARALRESGFAIADSSSSTGEIRTSPSYAWPAGSEKEKWHGAESPGVVLQVVARASGADSTFFGVTAVAPTREVAGGATSVATLRMLSAMTLVSRVKELLGEPVGGKQPR